MAQPGKDILVVITALMIVWGIFAAGAVGLLWSSGSFNKFYCPDAAACVPANDTPVVGHHCVKLLYDSARKQIASGSVTLSKNGCPAGYQTAKDAFEEAAKTVKPAVLYYKTNSDTVTKAQVISWGSANLPSSADPALAEQFAVTLQSAACTNWFVDPATKQLVRVDVAGGSTAPGPEVCDAAVAEVKARI